MLSFFSTANSKAFKCACVVQHQVFIEILQRIKKWTGQAIHVRTQWGSTGYFSHLHYFIWTEWGGMACWPVEGLAHLHLDFLSQSRSMWHTENMWSHSAACTPWSRPVSRLRHVNYWCSAHSSHSDPINISYYWDFKQQITTSFWGEKH